MSEQTRFRPVVRGALRRARSAFGELSNEDRTAVPTEDSDFTTDFDRSLTERFEQFFAERDERYSVLTEEQATTTASDADYLVIVDEIDGTANLANGIGELPFGPVIAICDDIDPTFGDVVAMGYLVLPTGDLYEAYRDEGAFLTRRWAEEPDGRRTRLQTTAVTMSDQTPPGVLVDQYMLAERSDLASALWGLGYPGDFRSLGHHSALVARGAYDVAVSGDYCLLHEGKRSTAEELAGAFRLVAEAGGTVTDWNGRSLRSRRIGFTEGKPHDVVVAANREFATEVAELLSD
ncbi:fructose-1,6-bisphosphatase [Halopelagius inordinatus]|uniref:fructose-bisphosphatase n=1 Tax=Halopelagius inordinatus TaxID=553467 RepID=A0A1I2U8H2_9EURY|nr:inositol monophosphatase family protein [Halopelagius inordinatus]SFG73420.1 fructose-1,6-bisphosphatase [Halopelagius inordinatus]